MNVYLIEDEGGVTVFDAGSQHDAPARSAPPAVRFGGIRRVVLGHADCDHRGGAAGLDAPVYCHPLERSAAQSPSPVPRLLEPEPASAWAGPSTPGCCALGRRCARDRRHASRRTRRSRASGPAPSGARARADRAVPRGGRPRAGLRLLVHAQPGDRHRECGARAASGFQPRHRPGARRRSGVLRRSTPRSSGPGTPSPSPVPTSSCNFSAPRRLPSSLAQMGKRARKRSTGALASGPAALNAVARRRPTPTRTATSSSCAVADAQGARRVRGDAERRPPPGGRLAAGDRAAV